MNKLNFFFSSKGIGNVWLRIGMILKRYGVSPSKYEKYLNEYIGIVKKFDVFPSFPITTCILKRYYKTIKHINEQGTEIEIHGYSHNDHTCLSENQLIKSFLKAIKDFNSKSISIKGFRSPYLRWNEDTMIAIGKAGFAWDSSESVVWDIVPKEKNNPVNWLSYQKILDFCDCKNALNYPVLPYFKNGFVEIPVSLPDDEILVDRLGVTYKERIGSIWTGILDKTYGRGEIFTLQLHPERIFLCDKALEMVLFQAKKKNPPVWIAQLGEIAKWWREKDKFEAKIQRRAKNEYQINLSCSDRATILMKNLDIQSAANALNAHNETNETDQTDQIDENWYGSYRVVNQKNFVVKSNCCPVIGLSPDSSPELVSFLRQDGYITKVSDKKSDYGIYLEGINEFSPDKKLRIIKRIESSDAPLVRFWRWPNRARSTLSITGDIDAITIWDFIFRLFGR